MQYINLRQSKKYGAGTRRCVPKLFLVLGALVLMIAILIAKGGVRVLFAPLSVFSKIINPNGLKENDGRVNILALGLDVRSDNSPGILTDTIIVASIDTRGKNAALISIPRDLWVPLSQTYSGKINSAYSLGGIDLTKKKVEEILGIPIHYWGIINFEGFKKAIDVLGGIEIDVENSFDDYRYPIPGKEKDTCGLEGEQENPSPQEAASEATKAAEKSFPCRVEHLHFDKGYQKMDGETALKYARSRYAIGVENGDFARARRQQKVIAATREKVLSFNTLTNPLKIKELFETYKKYIETNLGFPEVQALTDIGLKIKSGNVKNTIINKENGLLISPSDNSSFGGASVLLPKGGDFSQIQAFVQEMLFD